MPNLWQIYFSSKTINTFRTVKIVRKSSLSSKSTPQSQLGPVLDRSISWCQNRMRCAQINQIQIICYSFICIQENCLIRLLSLLSLRGPAYTAFCQMRRILFGQKLRAERMTGWNTSPLLEIPLFCTACSLFKSCGLLRFANCRERDKHASWQCQRDTKKGERDSHNQHRFKACNHLDALPKTQWKLMPLLLNRLN